MRCGTKKYKGKEIPANADIKEYQGRECYLSGIELDYKIVRFIDTGEILKVKSK